MQQINSIEEFHQFITSHPLVIVHVMREVACAMQSCLK